MTTNVTALPVPSFMNDIVPLEGFGDPKSIMIHAEPGKGKTLTGAGIIKVPGINSAIILDIDNGTSVLLNDPEVMEQVRAGNVKIIAVDKTAPDAFQKFDTYFWEIVNNNGYGFDAFIVDTFDVGQETALDFFLATTFNDAGNALDGRKAYSRLGKWSSDMLWALQNNPNFVGITLMHTKTEEEKKTKVSTLKPKLAGAIRDSAAGIPDVVAYLTKDENEDGTVNVIADMSGVGEVVSKQRYSSFLPNRMENFSLPAMYAAIRGGAAAHSPSTAPIVPIAAPTQTEPAAAAVSA